jgi:hypothetical protein
VPGVVEFENYDVGGPEVSFSDRDGDNRGGHYRQDAVDIKASDKASNGAIVGFAFGGEWMEYTIEVTEAGQYRPVLAYVAPGEGTRVRLSLDGEELTAVPQAGLPATDDWDDLGTYTFDPITLPKGDAVLRVTILAGPVDLDRMQFVSTNQAN